MKKAKPNEFVVHCIMCGKDFRVGEDVVCGGLYNGKPLCRTTDIQREMASRLPQKPANAKLTGRPRDDHEQ